MRVIIKCAPRRLIGIDCVNKFIVDNVAPPTNYFNVPVRSTRLLSGWQVRASSPLEGSHERI